jgi:cystathionine beta-synthase
MKKGQRLVVLFADSVRNYMTKFLNDNWMIEGGFMEASVDDVKKEWWNDQPVSHLQLNTPLIVSPDVSCSQCVDILNKNGYDQLPCIDAAGNIQGMVTLGNLTSQILSGRVRTSDPISKVLYRQFNTVRLDTKLGKLSKLFDRDHFALVVTSQKNYTAEGETEKKIVYGVATRIDLLNYILQHDAQGVKKQPAVAPATQ